MSEILRDTGHKGNCIPSGRQLQRTPPLSDVKRHLDFCDEDSNDYCEEPQQNTEAGTREQDNDQHRTFDFNTPQTKTEDISEPNHHNSMLKGMKGYQLTAADLEFIEKMKEEKLVKKLQGDLEEVQKLLKREMMALQRACAAREREQAVLNKFPSCEELAKWIHVVLEMTSPSTELTDLDTKSLLAMVTKDDIQRAMDKKRTEMTQMKKIMAKKKKEAEAERGQLEKQIAAEQLKVQGLMNQLSSLMSELIQEEEAYKALQLQIKTQEEIRVEAEVEETSEELQEAKSQVKHGGKERKKAVRFREKIQETTNQSKSTRSKHTDHKTDSQASLKDHHVSKNTNETLKTSATKQKKQNSEAVTEKPTKSVKAARGPQKKVEEQESNSQESVQAVRGRRKLPGTAQTTATQPKNQTKVKSGRAQSMSQQAAPSHSRKKAAVAPDDAGEEAQNTGLRRSKRIASRK